jgi:hypothetical protein
MRVHGIVRCSVQSLDESVRTQRFKDGSAYGPSHKSLDASLKEDMHQ